MPARFSVTALAVIGYFMIKNNIGPAGNCMATVTGAVVVIFRRAVSMTGFAIGISTVVDFNNQPVIDIIMTVAACSRIGFSMLVVTMAAFAGLIPRTILTNDRFFTVSFKTMTAFTGALMVIVMRFFPAFGITMAGITIAGIVRWDLLNRSQVKFYTDKL